MLARLSGIAGVDSAEIDHRGELLRVRARTSAAIDRARAALTDLGYDASAADLSVDQQIRWYDAASVRDLSREEARIIAQRVLSGFAGARDLDSGRLDELRTAITGALFGVFASHELGVASRPGTFLSECVRAVEQAAAEIIGSDRAREISSILERDLR